MNPRYFLLFCSFVVVKSKSFYGNQHLPLSFPYPPQQQPQPPQAFAPYYTRPKTGYYQNEPPQSGDYSDLLRQYQQWQIAIPNQQQGGVVWISAPIYGQAPPNAPSYPPAPPPYQPGPAQPGPANSTHYQNTIVRDTEVAPPNDDNSPPPYEPEKPPTEPEKPPTEPEKPPTEPEKPPTEPEKPPTEPEKPPTEPEKPPTEPEKPPTEPEKPPTEPEKPPTEPEKPPTHENVTQPPINTTNSLLKYCKQPRGQFADPTDCHKFINCWDNAAFRQDCPAGLVFNEQKRYCDYAGNVSCSSSPGNGTSPTSPPPTKPPTDGNSTNPHCPSPYGTYRNTSDCAAFYVCVSGEPVDFICPPGTAYSDELKVCDYPYRVDCKGAPYKPAPTEKPYPEEPTTNSSSEQPPASPTPPPYTYRPTEPTASPTSPPYTYRPTESPTPTSPPTEATSPTPTPSRPAYWSTEGPPPPAVDPIALYNFNLKKLPESIVNTNVRCYHQNMFRLTPDCSSVTICQDGLTYIVNCGQSTSFDAYSQRCVPTSRARC